MLLPPVLPLFKCFKKFLLVHCLSDIPAGLLIRMQETANKQKRITLKTIHQMLDGMSVELAEKVHLLFIAFFRFSPSPLSQEGLHLSLSLAKGRPLSRLDRAKASIALCSLLHRFPLLRRGKSCEFRESLILKVLVSLAKPVS